MKKSLILIYLFLILIFSVVAVNAEDVNSTDSSIVSLNDTVGNYDSLKSCNSDSLLNDASKNMTELDSHSNDVYYKGTYQVSLKDSNSGIALANRTVTFSIEGKNYTALTDDYGVAGLKLNLNVGRHTITSTFMGDDIYENCTLTSYFNVLSTIKASDITKYYKAGTQYTATFLDSQGIPQANRNVNITLNGKTYSKKTNSNGVVSMPVNLKPGTYRITSTDPLTGYKLTTTFRILATITSSDVQKFIGDGKKFTAKFYNTNGKPLAKKYVKFNLKGKTYNVKTNAEGKASLSLNKLKKGTYNIVCYNTDGYKKTFKIQIYNKKATTKLTTKFYTFFEDETKQITVKFETSIGGQSVSGKAIKININGDTYSKKTDANGNVLLDVSDLSKGIYTVSYSYAGTKYFQSSKSTNYVTVLNETDTRLKVKSTTSFGYGAGTEFKVLLSAGGVPLAKKTVTFKIGSNKYVKTTDYKGIATLPINLAIGNYTVKYSFAGDSYVNESSGSCDIDVFKRDNTKLTWMSGSSFKDSIQIFKIKLTDSDGNPIEGERVILKIDGGIYHATTSSKGIATFKTVVAFGGYKVSFRVDGNNFYMPSSASKSIKVKLSSFGNGVNQKASGISSKYLKSSSHCKVGTKAVKKLVKKLTKGMKNNEDKAKAIFNYVRDTLSYRYYYDTRYGSSKTLKYKAGNCVDHSHLLVAMFRTAGLKARYVHGTCTFNSGNVYGHVWTQVYIGNHWVCGDAISYSNQLGKIQNWNTKTVKVHAGYRSLPF